MRRDVVGTVNGNGMVNHDRMMHDLDRFLFFGHEPSLVLHDILGTGFMAYVLQTAGALGWPELGQLFFARKDYVHAAETYRRAIEKDEVLEAAFRRAGVLRVLVARVQGAELDRYTVILLQSARLINASSYGFNSIGVTLQVGLRIVRSAGALTQHVV